VRGSRRPRAIAPSIVCAERPVGEAKLQEVAVRSNGTTPGTRDDDDVGDDRLRLIFTCCHPALAVEAQVALTLRTLAGLTTAEIARAFLVPEPTMAQRLVRAKAQDPQRRDPVSRAARALVARANGRGTGPCSTCCSTRAMRQLRAPI
jgi:predicted RNA polymerase sigma factor